MVMMVMMMMRMMTRIVLVDENHAHAFIRIATGSHFVNVICFFSFLLCHTTVSGINQCRHVSMLAIATVVASCEHLHTLKVYRQFSPVARQTPFIPPEFKTQFARLEHLHLEGKYYDKDLEDVQAACPNLRSLYLHDVGLLTEHMKGASLQRAFPRVVFEQVAIV